jgi:nucleoside-diphosphate-sugar epimerase
MKIVITGGAGFIGQRLARRILELGTLPGPSGQSEPIDALVLADIATPAERPAWCDDRVRFVAGDIAAPDIARALIDRPDIGVFHLASIVSGGAEQDFDRALDINLAGHLNLLDALRRVGSRPRHVFSSSIACYGGAADGQVGDDTRHTPRTTYGMTKAAGELLVTDYTRKGFIDGRGGRLATVIVRPGKPNAAASGFASAIIREPLNGVDYTLPVPLDTVMAVTGYRTAVEALIALYALDGAQLGHDRALNLPNLSVSMAEMAESLHRLAAGRKLGRINVAVDPAISAIVAGWPRVVRSERGDALELPRDGGIDAVVGEYIEDYLGAG